MARDEIIYSLTKRNFIPGHRYANPRYFDGPADGVKSVIVVGKHPDIVDTYRLQTEGVKIVEVEDDDALAALFARRMTGGKSDNSGQPHNGDGELRSIGIPSPEDVTTMAWPKLRHIASQVSDTPVNNRKEAEAAVEAERARRDAA